MPHKDPLVRVAYNKRYSAEWHQRNRDRRHREERARAQLNPEAARRRSALYRARHREKVRASGREAMYRASERIKQRARTIRRKFNVTPEEYTRMEEAQGFVCGICKQPEKKIHKRSPDPTRWTVGKLSIDHDHKTDRVRGLLCCACNIAIGHFEDDPARLRAAAEYLER